MITENSMVIFTSEIRKGTSKMKVKIFKSYCQFAVHLPGIEPRLLKGPRPLEQCHVRSVEVCASTSVAAAAS
jgi:hypothetical protein